MQTDLWAMPLFVNARVSVPILIFEPYIGGGIGDIYADYDAGASFANDDFVLAYDAFIGLAGEVVDFLEPHTEAEEAGLLISFLVGFGGAVGRGRGLRTARGEPRKQRNETTARAFHGGAV